MPEYFYDPAAVAEFAQEKMKKVSLYESPRMFCDVYCLQPGQQQRVHRHAENDKVYHALSGACSVQIGSECHLIEPGQVAIAPAGVDHGVRNDSDMPATLLVIMAPHPSLNSGRNE